MTGTTAEPNAPRSRTPRALSYSQWMAVAAEEYDRLLRLLRSLEPEQWRAATDCEGWQVRDVVAHLAGAAAATASLREQVRQARRSRRYGADGDLVDRMNRLQVDERHSCSPEALLGDLEAASRRGVAARRRIPAPLRALRLPFGPPLGTRPLGYLMGRVYSRDAWMHRVDLARATGAALELSGEHDGAIVEDVVAEWADAHGAGFDLRLTGPAGGRWVTGAAGPAEAIHLDAVDLARTLSGREAGQGLLATRVPF